MSDSPMYQDGIYKKAAPRLKIMDDVSSVETIRQKKYLFKFPEEKTTKYETRIKQAEYNNVLNETIGIGVSKLTRKPINYGDMEDKYPELFAWKEKVDLSNDDFDEYAKKQAFKAIKHGLFYTFVDFPYVEGLDSMTNAQKAELNLSPRLSNVLFGDIVNRIIDENGELSQVTIKETVTKPDGRFGEKTVNRYRVIWIESGEVRQELYEETEQGGELMLIEPERIITPSDGIRKLVKIPLVPWYTGQTAPHNAIPPLLNQAHTLISWFNTNSQYQKALTDAGDPTLLRMGAQQDEMGKYPPAKVGTDSVIDVTENGSAEWLELKGNSLPEFREKLSKLEEQLESYKTSIQVKDASVSVKQTGIENADKVSKLYSWSSAGTMWANGIFEIVALYKGLEYDGHVMMNTDFDSYELGDSKVDKLSQLELRGQLTKESLLKLYKQGEILPDNFDIEKELRMIRQQSPL